MVKRKNVAKYGNTYIQREYCRSCRTYALVIDGEIQCCDKSVENSNRVKIKIMSQPLSARKLLSRNDRDEILRIQENRCLYCDVRFGDFVKSPYRLGYIVARLHWDHLDPYVKTLDNRSSNFVASCSICNRIKSDLVFENIEDVRAYIQYNRSKRGYETL